MTPCFGRCDGRGVEVRLGRAGRGRDPAVRHAGQRGDDVMTPPTRQPSVAARPLSPAPRSRCAGDLEALRGDPGARRRVARAARRRDPCARRRERCRQEHAGQDPRRRPPAGRRPIVARRRPLTSSAVRRTPGRGGSPSCTRSRVCSPTCRSPRTCSSAMRRPGASARIYWREMRRQARPVLRGARRPARHRARPSVGCRWPTSSSSRSPRRCRSRPAS